MSKTKINKSALIKRLAILISRIIFGCTFIFSGFVKAVDPMGSAYKFEEYYRSFGLESLSWSIIPAAFFLAAFEFMLGINILLGSSRKVSTRLALLTMIIMTPLTLYLALTNPVSDCGCFGDALVITNWETFFKNVVLITISFFLFKNWNQITPIFGKEVRSIPTVYALIFSLAISFTGYYFLPVIDFRPFKNGVNIEQAMQIPEGAKPSKYEYIFIYEKDGKRKEFTLDNYPANDSTWKFVDSQNRLIEQGYQPTIKDFTVINANNEPFTTELLNDTSYTFLLISPDLATANDLHVDRINEIYDYCKDHGYKFYCLTTEDKPKIAEWSENTGAEYPYLFSDEITLKTIIRSNPGLLLLKKGTILRKFSNNDLPSETDLQVRLEQSKLGKMVAEKRGTTIATLSAIFLLPLLILFFTEKTVSALMKRWKNRKMKSADKTAEQADINT